jgi:hypothetical protein
VVAGCEEYRFAEADELLEEKADGCGAGPFGFVQIAADRENVGLAGERFIDDPHERVGQRGTACSAAARIGKRRFQMDVGAVDEGEGHS